MKDCPFVMCLTNTVAANFTANVLLAIGAKPAMVEDPGEAAELAGVADALLVNVGTVHARQAEAMFAAVGVANRRGIPWVLDPVACQALSYRMGVVRKLIALRPTLVRCNRHEAAALGETGVPTLATGGVDVITAGGVRREIAGGTPMMEQVTAVGCSQGAVAAATLARGGTAEDASRLMKRAGELAYARAKAPGGFQIALVDALYELTHGREA